MSLTMSSSFGAKSESDVAESVVASLSTPTVSAPPIERNSCLICKLVRVAVPSFATRPASCATPGCVLYAVPRPASSDSATVIFGTLCSGTRTTVNPLSSFDSEIDGQLIGRGGAGGGGVACAKTFAARSVQRMMCFIISPPSPPARGRSTFDSMRRGTSARRLGFARRSPRRRPAAPY